MKKDKLHVGDRVTITSALSELPMDQWDCAGKEATIYDLWSPYMNGIEFFVVEALSGRKITIAENKLTKVTPKYKVGDIIYVHTLSKSAGWLHKTSQRIFELTQEPTMFCDGMAWSTGKPGHNGIEEQYFRHATPEEATTYVTTYKEAALRKEWEEKGFVVGAKTKWTRGSARGCYYRNRNLVEGLNPPRMVSDEVYIIQEILYHDGFMYANPQGSSKNYFIELSCLELVKTPQLSIGGYPVIFEESGIKIGSCTQVAKESVKLLWEAIASIEKGTPKVVESFNFSNGTPVSKTSIKKIYEYYYPQS